MSYSTEFATAAALLEQAAEWATEDSASAEPLVEWALPDDGAERLEDRVDRLKTLPGSLRRPLRLAFCGENNAGKSTLINAFIGENIAVSSFLEFTFAPMLFQFGTRRQVTFEFSGQPGRTVSVERLEAELTRLKDAPDKERLQRVVVELPLPALRNYELADVPGLGADERNARVAQAFTEKIDAVIFVLNAGLIGQSDMAEGIRSLVQEFPEVCLLVNKIDQIGFENTDRMIDYVRSQDFGRPVPVFPSAALGVRSAENDSPLPRQWMQDFRTEFIDRVSANAQAVQATTALAKCQRDIAVLESLLQTSYHQGTRTCGLVGLVKDTLQDAEAAVQEQMVVRLTEWLDREVFSECAAELRSRFLEIGAPSRPAIEALISDTFNADAMDREAQALARELDEVKAFGREMLAARVSEKCADQQSVFQLETTMRLVREQQRERSEAALVHVSEVDVQLTGAELAESITTDDERRMEGTLSGDDITGAGVGGLLTGGGATALMTWLGGATATTAVTGVGLPLAAGMAALLVGAKFFDRKRRQSPEATQAEFAELASKIRRDAVERLVAAQFPEGIPRTLAADLAAARSHCEERVSESLWTKTNPDRDLETLRGSIETAARLADELAGCRQKLSPAVGGNVSAPLRGQSAAACRAALAFEQTRRFEVDQTNDLQSELAAVLGLEDTQLTVIDRHLTGDQLEWYRDGLPRQTFLRVLMYDAEREPGTRSEFVHTLERIRHNNRGETAARAVRCAGDDRTPLDRVLLIGSDWTLELDASLSKLGQREFTIARLDGNSDEHVRNGYLNRFTRIAANGQGDAFEFLDL